MARPRRTQKETAELYKGNLSYYARFHLWRGKRLIVSLLAIAATIAGIWLFSKRGRETFFNPEKSRAAMPPSPTNVPPVMTNRS